MSPKFVFPLAAEKLNLLDVNRYFNLEYRENYSEWLDNLPHLTESEIKQLDRIKSNFIYLSQRNALQEIVKMVVLSPLLDMAGFYEPPFHTIAERPVNLSIKDRKFTVRGRMDILVIQNQFWVLVVESKRSGISLELAIPQVLTYMNVSPKNQVCYGLVTNGTHFTFMKLLRDEGKYSFSEEFSISRRTNELQQVLQIMKRLAKEFGTKVPSTNGQLVES
ncbi:MAG: type I restriction enzyme HsdR N-terminal domain-containing protein [Pseudanabaenaceae cyanobacterium bins.68]|nr:type I restriction enzyme HsdR N-terminal domain-containing protein [Pseudanabaenaceae cyanobacterium bins.68]